MSRRGKEGFVVGETVLGRNEDSSDKLPFGNGHRDIVVAPLGVESRSLGVSEKGRGRGVSL